MYFNKAFITKQRTTLVGNSFGTKTKKKIIWNFHCRNCMKNCTISMDILGGVWRNANEARVGQSYMEEVVESFLSEITRGTTDTGHLNGPSGVTG